MKTVTDIINGIQNNLSALGSKLANFSPYGNLYAIFRSVALLTIEQDTKLLDFEEKLYLTTSFEEDLDARAADYRLTRKGGTSAQGYVLVKSQAGVFNLPKGLVLTSPDRRYQFQLVNPLSASTTEDLVLISSLGSGEEYNLASGTRLYSSLFPTVTFTVGRYRNDRSQAQEGLLGGQAIESDFLFKRRILKHIQSLGSAGTTAIEASLLAIPSITKVFVKEHTPVTGYITVFINSRESRVLIQAQEALEQSKAAGVSYFVRPISSISLDVSLVVTVADFADSGVINSGIRSTLFNYFAQLALGQIVYPEILSSLALQQTGVVDVRVVSPSSPLVPPAESLVTLSDLKITFNSR